MTTELTKLREALRRVKYEAVSLADAQVIALEALTTSQQAQATPDVPETDFGNMVTQQATPEPVGEVSAESILNRWMAECGVYLVEKMGHQWASQTKQADLLYLVEKAISCTRPAPGVPEGFALVPVEPTPQMTTLVEHDMWDKPFVNGADVWSAVLAAAQAKGGEQ